MSGLFSWGPVVVIVLGYVLGFYFQNRRLDDLRDSINQRFDGVDKRFDDVNRRFDDVNQRFGDLSGRIDGLRDTTNQRFGDINQRFNSIDARFSDLKDFIKAENFVWASVFKDGKKKKFCLLNLSNLTIIFIVVFLKN